jgi:hypothetical protein
MIYSEYLHSYAGYAWTCPDLRHMCATKALDKETISPPQSQLLRDLGRFTGHQAAFHK